MVTDLGKADDLICKSRRIAMICKPRHVTMILNDKLMIISKIVMPGATEIFDSL